MQALADQFSRPITRAALSKYERGEVMPRADVLLELGRVLRVPAAYFLEEAPPPGVEWIAYRKHSRLGARASERIRARAELAAEAFLRLRDLLHPGEEPAFPKPRTAATVDDAEDAADALRAAWGLGSGPVEGLVGRVEDAGALVLGSEEGTKFDGLSGRAARGFPVIVLNTSRPDDRTRFNIAHELGHLLLDTGSLTPREEEQLANRFAAALLIPREAVYREVGRRRSEITLAELEHLKRRYGVSMQAWVRRAKDLGVLTEEAYRSWNIQFRSQGWHVNETATYEGEETPSRLRLLAIRALAERLVDREWVRRFCPEALEGESTESKPASAIRQLLVRGESDRRTILEAAAQRAAKDYAEDSELEEFLAFDDELDGEGTGA